jgi:hypothetical protein
LRGLRRPEPLPCTKMTSARAGSGMRSVPTRPSGGMCTSTARTPPLNCPVCATSELRITTLYS